MNRLVASPKRPGVAIFGQRATVLQCVLHGYSSFTRLYLPWKPGGWSHLAAPAKLPTRPRLPAFPREKGRPRLWSLSLPGPGLLRPQGHGPRAPRELGVVRMTRGTVRARLQNSERCPWFASLRAKGMLRFIFCRKRSYSKYQGRHCLYGWALKGRSRDGPWLSVSRSLH